MKKIIIFTFIFMALSGLFALDLSYGEGHALLNDGVTPHAQNDFGFTIIEYPEITVTGCYSGHTYEECEAEFYANYVPDFTYYFNIEGHSNNGTDVYDENDGGYFLMMLGGFVDNTTFGQTGNSFYNDNGFAFPYDFINEAEITYYGNEGVTNVEYLVGTGDNAYYPLGDVVFGDAPSNPGEGSGGYTGEPGSQPGDPIYIDVTPIDIPGFGNVNPDVTINPDGAVDITVDVVVLPDAVTPGAPNADLSYGLTFTGDVAGQTLAVTLSYDGFTGTPQFIYWWNGSGWEVPIALDWTVPGQVSFTITMPVGRAGDTEIVLGENDPLPVTLTNFAAEYMQNQFVRVNWTAESECNMNGYILYRSQSDFANVEYSSEIIEANNSPETQIYSFEDYEVEVNDTYHYWIEALDMDGTTFLHGPVSVTINEENGPELPDATVLNSNYPNPFNPVTTISFAVKDGEIAELSIFNAKGQVVLTESFESKAGGYTYTWDASKNGTGVYFYKLQSPSYSNVKKMIMIK